MNNRHLPPAAPAFTPPAPSQDQRMQRDILLSIEAQLARVLNGEGQTRPRRTRAKPLQPAVAEAVNLLLDDLYTSGRRMPITMFTNELISRNPHLHISRGGDFNRSLLSLCAVRLGIDIAFGVDDGEEES